MERLLQGLNGVDAPVLLKPT